MMNDNQQQNAQDISEEVWTGCERSEEVLLSVLFRMRRYDLLEGRLALCGRHCIQKVRATI